MDITTLSDDQLAQFRKERLGFDFQDFNLLDTLTMEENITLAMALHKKPAKEIRKRTAEIMERLGIGDIKDKFPHQVSGGQKRRMRLRKSADQPAPADLCR